MKYLFYFYSCFNSTALGGLIDEAIELSKNPENDVLFVYCGGINKMCMYINPTGSKTVCSFCSRCTQKILKKYNFKINSLVDYYNDNDVNFNYENSQDLRAIKYRGVHIGLSIMSDYITVTRNLNPLIDVDSKKYFDAHLQQNVNFVDALFNLINNFNPDVLYTFNGRFEEVRPIYDISRQLNLNCILSEVIKKSGIWYKVMYYDNLPHDIKYNVERREYCWNHYTLSEEERIKLGNDFYNKRRNGEESGDVKIYVADQVEGNISCFRKDKQNVAIFNSSEDEFAAVGGDWDKLKLFDNQFEAIKFLLINADNSVHFILRIHPNLKNISYKFHKELYKLPEKYNNITVIPADSNASTYTIMDNCDKIVCFGSTMGVESSYWGKPAILMGPSLYYYDDVVYVPKSKEEVLDLLKKDLKPKGNLNLIKFGAYILNKDPLIVPTKNINCDQTQRRFFFVKYITNSIVDFLWGERITGLYVAFNRYFRQKYGQFVIPRREL